MSTLKLVSLQCLRRHDVMGVDEPIIYVGDVQAWNGVIGKGETEVLTGDRTDPHPFSGTIYVSLGEVSNGASTAIGYAQPVTDRPTNNGLAVFKNSGTHDELEYEVDA